MRGKVDIFSKLQDKQSLAIAVLERPTKLSLYGSSYKSSLFFLLMEAGEWGGGIICWGENVTICKCTQIWKYTEEKKLLIQFLRPFLYESLNNIFLGDFIAVLRSGWESPCQLVIWQKNPPHPAPRHPPSVQG
jgi:hypothetical protein